MFTLIVALIIIESLILTSLVHTEHEFWGLFTLVVAVACYSIIAGRQPVIDFVHTVIDNPAQSFIIVLGYLLVGVVWSFFKYYTYVRKNKREGATKAYMQAQNNTGRAIGWMAFWPFSMIAHIAGNGIYEFFVWIYNQVSGVYTRILNSVYGE